MRWLLVIAMFLSPAAASAWEVPERGSKTRAALMDAMRPHAEWNLGAPVQFVVHELRREGDMAYASLYAQRPGGGAIDQASTRIMQQGEAEEFMDVTAIQALYRKEGDTWVAVHFSFGATDIWFAYGPFCREYGAVLAEYCDGVAD